MVKICDKCKFSISAQNFKKHRFCCDGLGPRNKRPHHGQNWCKGKTYIEIYGEKKAKKIKETKYTSLLNSDKFKNIGRCLTDEKEKARKNKLSKSMLGNINWKNSIHKSGRGKRGYYKGYYFMSSWELAYIAYCLDNKLSIKRNYETFEYVFNNVIKKYIPDFLVEGEYVEVKGYYSEQFKAKKEQFPHKLEVIDKVKIKPIIKYVQDKWGIDFVNILKDQ